jgi:hypothetical protein
MVKLIYGMDWKATKHGVHNVNFKEFIVDSAQMNWNIAREIYGTGDKT